MNMETMNRTSLHNRPGILLVGSSNVGKRTLISRLISVDFEDASDSSSQVLVHGWTINTKYYMADVSLWMAHLHEGFSIGTLPVLDRLAAMVMVFDLNDLSTLDALKDWASTIDLKQFEVLLCIGNKVDLLPGHPVHAEYRRRLLNPAETSAGSCSDFTEYGISEGEGSSLLGDEEPSWEIRRSCLEWCTEHNVKYIEACASNADFDKCEDLLCVELNLLLISNIYDRLILPRYSAIRRDTYTLTKKRSSQVYRSMAIHKE
ncbi:hypothetical protein JRO89_XS08G0105500 [Xanthoceras sorbifolium]|uniref:Uncharacterized protein n=1 Tax=Xanthoceras sorbifolium TaxID=99658 RepID=A0ABQ8HP60_9ROSI|nr:hypothetical protein JRO89_XS08G0105500 [Xanthoceras sorbifolium]